MNEGVQAAVAGIVGHVDAPLQSMLNYNWTAMEAVGDHSPYISEIEKVFKHDIAIVMRVIVSKNYRNFLCRHLTKRVVPHITCTIFRIKRIEHGGAHQLQLDTQALKSILLQVPTYGLDTEEPIPASHRRYVDREIGKLDGLLKTIATPIT